MTYQVVRFLFSHLFILLCLTSTTALASEICLDPRLESQPILAEGRVTPFFAHAGRVAKFIFEKNGCPGLSPTALYCFLSQGRRLEIEKTYGCELKLKVNHLANKTFLGLDAKENGISPEIAWVKKDAMILHYNELIKNGNKSGAIPTDLSSLIERIQHLSDIEAGQDWTVHTNPTTWTTFMALKAVPGFENILFNGSQYLTPLEARSVASESLYEKLKPFTLGIFIALFGFLFSILSIKNEKFKIAAIVALVLLFINDVFGITLRVLISGRAPVTNMYETVMWSGFCVFTVASIVGFFQKNRKVWAFGFFGNALCLLMMNFAPGMLDGSIQPLVPVLRDNFWLSTHVTSVTISYSCFALSWLISNYVLLVWLLSKSKNAKLITEWNHIIRISMQVGAVFLALGVILGGVWADYSWGRFWGWDPKETWSLIALIIYMAILHGRYVGWFKDIVFTMMGAVGFLFVLMAWFGVNYILATGLHSYGFSSGGALFLATVFIAQLLVLAAALVKKKI